MRRLAVGDPATDLRADRLPERLGQLDNTHSQWSGQLATRRANFIPRHASSISVLALAAIAAAYSVLALAATYRSRRRDASYSVSGASASEVLKPLCGAEARLYEDLRSFCNQDHPCVQILFAVSDATDPAIATVRRLQREFAALDIELVIDPTQHGSNRKISNLINMLPRVKHDHLVIADSDVAVPRDYLKRVCAPLADPAIGLVTCPYYGHALAGTASSLGAMFINEWFMPAVDVAALFGSQSFVSGATIAIRRELLEQHRRLRTTARPTGR